MRHVLSFVAALAPLMDHTATLQAQTQASDGWTRSIHFAVGASLVQTDWTISHPVTSRSVRRMETINGIGNRPDRKSVV